MSLIQSVPSGYQNAVITDVQLAINKTTGALLVDDSMVNAPLSNQGMTGVQVAITGTGSAVQLASHACKQVIIIGSATSLATTLYGFSSAGCLITLPANTAITLPLSNSNQIWINLTAAATLYYVYFN